MGLNLRYARELLAESVFDAATRAQTSRRFGPWLRPRGSARRGLSVEARRCERSGPDADPVGVVLGGPGAGRNPQGRRFRRLGGASRTGPAFSPRGELCAISRAFGTPKPMLTNSYRPEMLNLRTFPTLMGYSSRILAESWESNTLYWVALADELYLPPGQLNVKIPQWTGRAGRAYFRVQPGRLARHAEVAARGGRG